MPQEKLFDLEPLVGEAGENGENGNGSPTTSIAGNAGEHFVCYDLLAHGIYADRVEHLPYDVVAHMGGRLLTIQVKASSSPTRLYRNNPVRYRFCTVSRHGLYSLRRNRYERGAFDVLALVALDVACIAYMVEDDWSWGPAVCLLPSQVRDRYFCGYSLERLLERLG